MLDASFFPRARGGCPDRQCKSCRRAVAKANYYAKRCAISPEKFDGVLAAQGGRCALCGKVEQGGRHMWRADHCHKTGKARGVLCRHCNIALGVFEKFLTKAPLEKILAYTQGSLDS